MEEKKQQKNQKQNFTGELENTSLKSGDMLHPK